MFILHIFLKIKNVKTYLHIHPLYLLQLREKEFLVKCKWSGSMVSSKIPWGVQSFTSLNTDLLVSPSRHEQKFIIYRYLNGTFP